MARKYIKVVNKKPLGRKLLPKDQLKRESLRARERFEKDKEAHERQKQWNRDYFKKNRDRIQAKKKITTLNRRNEAISILGGECVSCGELFEPKSKPCNLEFHHLYYDEYEKIGRRYKAAEIYRDVLRMQKNNQNALKKYNLLCHTCHQIETNVLKNPYKAWCSFERLVNLEKMDIPLEKEQQKIDSFR